MPPGQAGPGTVQAGRVRPGRVRPGRVQAGQDGTGNGHHANRNPPQQLVLTSVFATVGIPFHHDDVVVTRTPDRVRSLFVPSYGWP